MAPSRGLVIFDLDGTLLRGRTACEILADALGRSDEMRSFELLTEESRIASAREEMARWYRGISQTELLAFLEQAELAPGAREGIDELRDAGITVGIASITWRFAAESIAGRLGVSRVLATGLDPHGAIEHVWPRHKASWLLDLARQHSVPQERTAAIGDSAGDFAMLRSAAMAFYVGAEMPADPTWIHMIGADIRDVARRIQAAWPP